MTHDSKGKSMVGIWHLYWRKSWRISFFVQLEMIKADDIFRKEVGTSHQQQVGNESNGKVVRFFLAAVNLFNDFFFQADYCTFYRLKRFTSFQREKIISYSNVNSFQNAVTSYNWIVRFKHSWKVGDYYELILPTERVPIVTWKTN